MQIKHRVDQAPGITVKEVIDNNFSVEGKGEVKAAVVVQSRKGPVNTVFTVNANTAMRVLGEPLSTKRFGHGAEGVRQVLEALKGTNSVDSCLVVRAIAEDAKFPFIIMPEDDSEPTKSASLYGTNIEVSDGAWGAFFPVDGDDAKKVRIVIHNIDTEAQRFDVRFEELFLGTWRRIDGEDYRSVSIDDEAKSDNGLSAYITSVLGNRGSRFGCVINHDSDFSSVKAVEAQFEGGTAGSAVQEADYLRAIKHFEAPEHEFPLMFAAGIYSPAAIKALSAIADEKYAQFRFDIPPELNPKAAIDFVTDLGIQSWQTIAYHYPYESYDVHEQKKIVCGISGRATALQAQALGEPTGNSTVKSVHLVPAGEKRGHVGRSGVVALPRSPATQASAEELTIARINPVENGLSIGDCLTLHALQTYLRFSNVGSTVNFLVRDFFKAAKNVQFGAQLNVLEELNKQAKTILQMYVDAGAIVEPRDPERDGPAPFDLSVEQDKNEIDLFHLVVSYASSGVARRITVQIKLKK